MGTRTPGGGIFFWPFLTLFLITVLPFSAETWVSTRMRKQSLAPGPPPTLDFVATTVSGSSGTQHSFTAHALGADAGDRKIIVTGSYHPQGGNVTVSSMSVAGNAGTVVHTQTGAEGTSFIAIADAPTGSTGDIVINLSSSAGYFAIAVYRVTGLQSSTPTDLAHIHNAGTDPSVSLDVPAQGFAVAVVSASNGGSTVWTGLSENADNYVGGQVLFSSASSFFVGAQTGLSILANNGGNRGALVAAAWGN